MNPEVWQDHAWNNRLQSALLVLVLLGIGALAGHLLLGELGVWMALAAGLVAVLAEPAGGAALVLRLARARPLPPHSAPWLWQTLEALARRAGLPAAPVPHYVPSPVPNAFAVGDRNASAIAVTEGLLQTLNRRELAGVLAHEIAHVAHGDLRVMNLAAQVGRITAAFSLAGQFLLLLSIPSLLFGGWQISGLALALLLFAPQIALLAELGLSRVREFDADLRAAELTGDPQGLALALARIEHGGRRWYARLLPGFGRDDPPWLRSHPATRERVERLQSLAGPRL